MNKRGSVLIYGLMLGLIVMLLALALAPAVQDFTDDARDTDNLNCSSDSISNFDKASCIATDLTLFYFIGALILIGGLLIGAKLVF